MQVNGVHSGAAQLCDWHQGMSVASRPVYMDAGGRPVVRPMAIDQRHVQPVCGHQPVAAVRTEVQIDQTRELRKKLIDQIVWHLSVAGRQSGFPLFAGAFAQACRRQCQREVNMLSGAVGFTAIKAEQLLDCPVMHIATPRGMSSMVPVMDWLLRQEKLADSSLLCGVSAGPLGEQTFSWYIGGRPLFAIALLELASLVGLDIQLQEYQTSDGQRVALRTSRIAAAAWLNEQLLCNAHRIDGLAGIMARELQGLAVSVTASADYPQSQFGQRPLAPRQPRPDVADSPSGEGVPTCSSLPLMSFPMAPCMTLTPVVFPSVNAQMPSNSDSDASFARQGNAVTCQQAHSES